MSYRVKDIETGEVFTWSLVKILHEVNRGRKLHTEGDAVTSSGAFKNASLFKKYCGKTVTLDLFRVFLFFKDNSGEENKSVSIFKIDAHLGIKQNTFSRHLHDLEKKYNLIQEASPSIKTDGRMKYFNLSPKGIEFSHLMEKEL
jgi:DNA-binding MarR family transcriptional regulator